MFGFGLEGVLAARGSRGSIVVFGPVPFMRKESSDSHGLRFRVFWKKCYPRKPCPEKLPCTYLEPNVSLHGYKGPQAFTCRTD